MPNLSSTPAWESVVGITLAVLSGLFLGTSVVLRKRGLIDVASAGHDVIQGSTAYLKNAFWWSGMILQALGEICNFGAYAFCPTILVTPLGTFSIVFNATLSHYMLHEVLTFVGKIGCLLCVLGVVMIVIHAPTDQQTNNIPDLMQNVINPMFLSYSAFIVALILWLKLYAESKYAKKSPFVYIAMSSCGGSYLVLSAQGVGSSIVTSAKNWKTNNQFLQWPLYPLILFMGMTVVYQIVYLNKALASSSSAIIYPISYVCFTGMTIVLTSFLYREFPVKSIDDGVSIIQGFLVIACGVTLLYTSSSENNRIVLENHNHNNYSNGAESPTKTKV
ncbi:hypothetical protein HDU79_000222 [Rhizoclosmatium sp. JEL0117]|nr:hypothetical protein HDU79_000222 [Rhizoclosmatium sp. JEL0117]